MRVTDSWPPIARASVGGTAALNPKRDKYWGDRVNYEDLYTRALRRLRFKQRHSQTWHENAGLSINLKFSFLRAKSRGRDDAKRHS